jgi:hypothetical protein
MHLDPTQPLIQATAKLLDGELPVNRRQRALPDESIGMRAHAVYDEIIRPSEIIAIDHSGNESADEGALDPGVIHSPENIVTPVYLSSKEAHVGMNVKNLSVEHGSQLSPLTLKWTSTSSAAV